LKEKSQEESPPPINMPLPLIATKQSNEIRYFKVNKKNLIFFDEVYSNITLLMALSEVLKRK